MFHAINPDRGLVPTLWMVMLFVSILAMFGVLSGAVEIAPDFTKSIRPYVWDATQQVWTMVLGASWVASMILSWKYKRDVPTQVGAAVIASLPMAVSSFYLGAKL